MATDRPRSRLSTRPGSAASDRFQILSLSGGGFRGLFTAVILEQLEAEARKPLRDCFDLIAGTSIGGILACGIACGIPAKQMREAFETNGASVFDRTLTVFGRQLFRLPRTGLLGARYSQSGLDGAISAVLRREAETMLADVAKPLVVPAVRTTDAATVLFESGAFSIGNGRVRLKDVALATSAAPTYFPEHTIGQDSFVDGGIVANAPDTIAVLKALTTFGRHPREISLLSIGTAGEAMGEVYRPQRASGNLGWVVGRNLFGLTIAAQEHLAVDLSKELLPGRFTRIDLKPDKNTGKVIGLNKATSRAASTLTSMAGRALAESKRESGPEITALLRHVARH